MKKIMILLFGIFLIGNIYSQNSTFDISNISGSDTSFTTTISRQVYSWGIQFYASSLAGTLDGTVIVYQGNTNDAGDTRWANADIDVFPIIISADTSMAWKSSYNGCDELKITYTKNNTTGGDVEIFFRKYEYTKR